MNFRKRRAMYSLDALARVEGPNLSLRLIKPDDCFYVHKLRSDPKYNRYLSAVNGSPDEQRRWIEAYKEREANFREFYYVIERKDRKRCGVVRLYAIEPDSFTWGSWILDENKTKKAALESLVLSFGVGFEHLGLPLAHVDVRIENSTAQAIYRRFGMIERRRDDRNIYFTYTRDRFESDVVKHLAILDGEQAR